VSPALSSSALSHSLCLCPSFISSRYVLTPAEQAWDCPVPSSHRKGGIVFLFLLSFFLQGALTLRLFLCHTDILEQNKKRDNASSPARSENEVFSLLPLPLTLLLLPRACVLTVFSACALLRVSASVCIPRRRLPRRLRKQPWYILLLSFSWISLTRVLPCLLSPTSLLAKERENLERSFAICFSSNTCSGTHSD
jgi:hypothetical protein